MSVTVKVKYEERLMTVGDLEHGTFFRCGISTELKLRVDDGYVGLETLDFIAIAYCKDYPVTAVYDVTLTAHRTLSS